MGQGIVYCFRCSSRIVGADSDKGVAYPIGDRIACAACASELLPTLSPAERDDLLARMNKGAPTKRGEPTRRTPRRGTEAVTPRRGTEAAMQTPGNKTPLIIGGVVTAIIVLLLILMASDSNPSRPPLPEAPERQVERPAKTPVDVPKPKENVDAELARIDDSIAGVMRQEGFKEAIDYLTSARKRHDGPEWTRAIDQRLGRTNDDIQALYASLQAKAVDAKRRGAESEMKDLVDRIARWNLPERSASLKKALDATTASAAFKQGADGIVCIEAEHFLSKSDASGHSWTLVKAPAGFEGEGAMSGLPNDNTLFQADVAAKSPRLEYRVDFARTGTHYLWVRASAASDADNSVHAGLDGVPLPGLAAIAWTPKNSWVWANKRMDGKAASFTVSTAGAHVLNLWIREDGAVVDRLVITSDPKWAPKGAGPAESPR